MTRYDDGYEAIKLVMDDYELGENENYLDDVEDAHDENYPDSEYGMRNDEDDDNNSERSDAETEYADEALVYAQFLNNERREEIESLEEQIRSHSNQMASESTVSGVMTVNMMINQAEERIQELRRQIASSRDLTS